MRGLMVAVLSLGGLAAVGVGLLFLAARNALEGWSQLGCLPEQGEEDMDARVAQFEQMEKSHVG